MKRILIMMALALAFIVSATAQDRIYFNDSRIENAVVDQIGSRYIKYRLYNNPDGPVRSAATYDVAKIIFEDGEVRTFSGRSYYDEGLLFEERALALLGDKPMQMRYDNGNLYLGSHSRYGAMQADIIAFNLYGDEYYAARRCHKWGNGLTWAGTILALGGFTYLISDYELGAGYLLAGTGAACLGAGIPLLVKGNKRLKGIADDYNSRYAGKESVELTFGPCRSGVGFALNF